MKIDSMVDWSAEERATKEKEWRQALFTLRLQKATGQLENPMKIKELRKDIARLKTLVHMDAARVASQKAHAEQEAEVHAVQGTATAATAAEAPAEGSEEDRSSKGKKSATSPKTKGKATEKGKAASTKASGKKTVVAAKKHSPSKKKSTSPRGKAGSSATPASKTKSK